MFEDQPIADEHWQQQLLLWGTALLAELAEIDEEHEQDRAADRAERREPQRSGDCQHGQPA